MTITEIVDFIFQEGRTLVYFIASAYALYFYHTKIGFNITASYQTGSGLYTEEQVTKLILNNKKDRTVQIWSIYLVIENDIKIELYNPEEPIVLKGGESLAIKPEAYTKLTVGADQFKPKFGYGNIKFYVNTGSKVVKCGRVKVKDNFLANLKQASVLRTKFGGHLYDDSVLYILVYFLNGKEHTAFIDKHGFIGNEWGLSPNSFGEQTLTPQLIEATLKHYGYTEIFSNYVCFERKGHDFEVAFRKRT
ncbi:hypothetical protein BCV29_02505 [Vibrio cyclitrophicus]|uniref:hypothetical protein n=2 Tax=Vibrio cyclitrophicus TaxID=47951 RepID=UPI000C859BAF|nr:hypothetical protein [Vibrio cyclitrophicus]PME72328.1 hypothetical protein BCV29_21240 [Vibrio cyclitrophicus]PMF59943.1 hypothetical protein BCV09_03790 [Vibrio cyclitrophicus]PMJ35679.1 hypothetical protein BCU24_05675 [Vibrio cyclitrophicus]